MSHTLSWKQRIWLILAVITTVGVGVAGVRAIAAKQGLWEETVELTVGLPDAHDITPGTAVRVRGLDAGQVTTIDYPPDDGPLVVRFRLTVAFRNRLNADARAVVQSTGLLGAKVININPGTVAAGPLVGETVGVGRSTDLSALAAEGESLVKELRELVADTRGAVKRVDGVVETEAAGVRDLVKDGRAAVSSVRQNSDAVAKLPLVRNYVENPAAVLVRPDCRRDAMTYNTADLFEPGTSILTDPGRNHLTAVTGWLKGITNDKADVVVAAVCDPMDPSQTAPSADLLTKKQTEAVVEYLRGQGVHKMGWWSRRKITAIGLGHGPSPAVEKEKLPASYLQVVVFTPS